MRLILFSGAVAEVLLREILNRRRKEMVEQLAAKDEIKRGDLVVRKILRGDVRLVICVSRRLHSADDEIALLFPDGTIHVMRPSMYEPL